MKTIKEVYFDLEDLGTTFLIKGCQFIPCNDNGVICSVNVEITDDEICKEFNIPKKDLFVADLDLITYDDNGVDGVLFAMQGPYLVWNNDNTDSYTSACMLEVCSDTECESIPNVHLNDNLIRVLEAYATSQFRSRLGLYLIMDDSPCSRESSDEEDDLLYVRKYLLYKNFSTLVKKDEEIMGKNIDYPIH